MNDCVDNKFPLAVGGLYGDTKFTCIDSDDTSQSIILGGYTLSCDVAFIDTSHTD